MTTFVFVIMFLSGILFIISILLMTPKWGLWFGISGMSTSNEYSSKKSVESTLKRTAIFSIILFTLLSVIYPYIDKKELSTIKVTIDKNTLNNWNDTNFKNDKVKANKDVNKDVNKDNSKQVDKKNENNTK